MVAPDASRDGVERRPGASTVPRALRLMFLGVSCSVARTAQDWTMRVVSLCTKSRRRLAMRSCSRAMRPPPGVDAAAILCARAPARATAPPTSVARRAASAGWRWWLHRRSLPVGDAEVHAPAQITGALARTGLKLRRLCGIGVQLECDFAPLHAGIRSSELRNNKLKPPA